MTAAVLRTSDTAVSADDELLAYLAADRAKPLLRFVTCGSVDDGKSTLIGRLLYDSKQLFQDQLDALERDSNRFGTQGGALDLALLVDGLSAEREQGITIDVAYRYFASNTRKFIVADAPGHEQYTRNMATAASTADLAVILIDATQGVRPQTRRHSHIVRLLGVRTIVLAVNKMDLVGYDRARFDAIVADYAAFAAEAGIADVVAVPMVALTGENVTRRGTALRWHDGPTLVEALEHAPTATAATTGAFAMPVQWVSRPDASFRGFAGTIARGRVAVGDPVQVLPGGRATRIARIVTFDGDLAEASAGQAATLVLADEVECAAGATLAAPGDALAVGDTVTGDIVWFDEAPLQLGRRYLLQTGAGAVPAYAATIDAIQPIPGAAPPDGHIRVNSIGVVGLRSEQPIAAARYADSRALGAFVLIDRESHATVAAGMIRAVAGATSPTAPHLAPVYAFAEEAGDAAPAVAALRARGLSAILLDRETLRGGVAADLPAGDEGALWRAAIATATLLASAGVTVALALDPPPGAEPFGTAYDEDAFADWSI